MTRPHSAGGRETGRSRVSGRSAPSSGSRSAWCCPADSRARRSDAPFLEDPISPSRRLLLRSGARAVLAVHWAKFWVSTSPGLCPRSTGRGHVEKPVFAGAAFRSRRAREREPSAYLDSRAPNARRSWRRAAPVATGSRGARRLRLGAVTRQPAASLSTVPDQRPGRRLCPVFRRASGPTDSPPTRRTWGSTRPPGVRACCGRRPRGVGPPTGHEARQAWPREPLRCSDPGLSYGQ